MKKILIIGDVMLDVYYNGNVSKISPEAPVPVLNVENVTRTIGGAGNVAANVAMLDGLATIAGMIGEDGNGDILRSLFEKKGIDTSLLFKKKGGKTITKTRLVDRHQQLLRMDENDFILLDAKEERGFLESIKERIKQFDTIVISDYKKGVCSDLLCEEIIYEAKRQEKLVLVDPKGKSWDKYCHSDIITPNFKEINDYLGMEMKNEDSLIAENCKGICKELDINNLLVTRSEKGITCLGIQGDVKHFSATAKEVYDVSGAGDTVIATLAVFFDGNNIEDAINRSNVAAGIVIGKKGTATVSAFELEQKINENQIGEIRRKIVTIEELLIWVKQWRQKGEKVSFTNGCFDIVHKGHIHSLFRASQFAEHLIVAVNSDESVRRLKGEERPINYQEDRAYVLAALACVDAVIIFNEDTPLEILKKISPDVLIKGGDYRIDEIVGREYADKVEIIEYLEGYSTTSILKNCEKDG